MLFVSTFCSASPAPAWPVKAKPAAKLAVVQTAAAGDNGRSQYCGQLEDTEAVATVYTQNNTFGPAMLTIAHGQKPVVCTVSDSGLATRDNARPRLFCQLILFPFHGFW